jgi:phage terminase large subunit-like protein
MDFLKMRELWDKMSPEKRRETFASLTKDEQILIACRWEFMARKSQLPPTTWGGEHKYWLIISGRGFGKTRVGAEEVLNRVENEGKTARIALIGRTSADVRDTMIEGESGLLACAARRGMKINYMPSKRRLEFENGALATYYTAEKPDQLRGPQHTFAWCDELSSWEYDSETWDMMMFGLRLGDNPCVIITTTPKPRKLMKELLSDKTSVITRGSTFENKDNLSDSFLEAVKEKYEGTRLGRQELYGELLTDNPDALWSYELIDAKREKANERSPSQILSDLEIDRVVVAIDPAVTSGDKADETGIVVVGKSYGDGASRPDRAFVLADYSGRYRPDEWAGLVNRIYDRWQADRVVAEVNNGGDLVETVLRTHNPNLSYRGVTASKGKRTRAEPIAALYEQGKVSHVGTLVTLEEQMCDYTPDGYDGSPDRVDALVWG